MDSPEDAFNLLTTTDEEVAGEKADYLEKLNKERKTAVAGMTRELHKRINGMSELPAIIVLGNPDWRPSLVGLTASKLADEHNRPVFIWGKDGNGAFKGSCRSGGGISIIRVMESVSAVFEEFGGHHYSGGFTVKEDQIFTLSEQLTAAFNKLGDEAAVEETIKIDEVIDLESVTYALVKELRHLTPFGMGNTKPLFAFKNVQPRVVEQFGKTKEHLKLQYESSNGALEAIAFFSRTDSFPQRQRLISRTL